MEKQITKAMADHLSVNQGALESWLNNYYPNEKDVINIVWSALSKNPCSVVIAILNNEKI